MSRLTKNILYNLIGQIAVIALGFVSVKYTFQKLGEEALGIIYFTSTVNAFLSSIFSLGIGTTTTREVASRFESDPSYIRDMIRTFSLFYWCIYALLGIAVFFLAPVLVQKWVNLKTMEPQTAVYMLRLLGIASLSAFPLTLYGSLFTGLQWMGITNCISIAGKVLQQFGTIVILCLHGDVFAIVHWNCFCYLTPLLVYLALTGKVFTWSALRPGLCVNVVRQNWRFALKMTSMSFLATIHTQTDKLIIGKLLPIEMLGYYAFAYSNTYRGQMLTGAVTVAAYPHFSQQFNQGDHQGMSEHYWKLHDFVCLISVPVFAAVLFALVPIFAYIFTPQISRLLFWPTTFLCIGTYMNTTLHIPVTFSLAVGKPEIVVRLNFYALFAVLPATTFLTCYWGLTGAAFAWIVYHIFAYSYCVPQMCSQCLKFSSFQWYFHIAKIFILSTMTYGIAWGFVAASACPTIFQMMWSYIAASALFATGAWMIMRTELRQTAYGYYRSIMYPKN